MKAGLSAQKTTNSIKYRLIKSQYEVLPPQRIQNDQFWAISSWTITEQQKFSNLRSCYMVVAINCLLLSGAASLFPGTLPKNIYETKIFVKLPVFQYQLKQNVKLCKFM